MRIGVNARLLSAPSLRGWSRYTLNLLGELPQLGVGGVLYLDAPVHPSHRARLEATGFQTRVSKPMRYTVWEQGWLPLQCLRDGVDLLHTPLNFGIPLVSPCPTILTLHDAIGHLERRQQRRRERWRLGPTLSALRDWSSRQRADRIITVSEHAKQDLVAKLGLRPSRVSVIHEAADPVFHEPISEATRARALATYGITRPYVFYLGGWEARKNVPFLVRAFAQAELSETILVLAGGQERERTALRRLATTLGVADRVHLLGWVEDADLPALYAGATAFVYPSSYEGFGLQLCEAMAVGCPVLAADATSLPEVLGSGGETFALDRPAQLQQLLERVERDPAFRRDLAARARARSAAFSWRRTAEETVAVYDRALERQ